MQDESIKKLTEMRKLYVLTINNNKIHKLPNIGIFWLMIGVKNQEVVRKVGDRLFLQVNYNHLFKNALKMQ